MKKLWIILLSVMCVSFQSVTAAVPSIEIIGLKPAGETITLEGTLVNGLGSEVAYRVMPSSAVASAPLNSVENVIAAGQVRAESGGKLNLSFKMPSGAASGIYTIVLGAINMPETVSKNFDYVSRGDRKTTVDFVNEKDGDAIFDSFSDAAHTSNYLVMGCLLDDLHGLSASVQKEAAGLLANGFYGKYTKPYDEEKIVEVFNAATAFASTVLQTNTDVSASLKKYSNIFGIDTTDLQSNTYLTNRIRATNARNGIEGVALIYNEALAIIALNETFSYQNIYKLLLEKNNIFELDFSGYTSLADDEARAKVDIAMTRKNFQSLEALQQAFYAAVLTAAQGGGGYTGGGNGYTGGGSGGTGASFAIAKNTTAEGISQPAHVKPFADLDDSHWAYEAVTALFESGIVNGVGNGLFDPEASVTRAEFVKMLVEGFALTDASAVCDFNDVPEGYWGFVYIASASKLGITNGIDGESFGSSLSVSRQDMAVMSYRTLQIASIALEKASDAPAFSDEGEIDEYAVEAVTSMAEGGIINGMGDGSFAPNDTATRAQAAQIIYLMTKKGGLL